MQIELTIKDDDYEHYGSCEFEISDKHFTEGKSTDHKRAVIMTELAPRITAILNGDSEEVDDDNFLEI